MCPGVVRLDPLTSAGDGDRIHAPLIEDQVEAGAQPVLALLERRDAGITGGDFEGDGGGRESSCSSRTPPGGPKWQPIPAAA
jgi:hypothetical protein